MANKVSNVQSDSIQEEWRPVPGFDGYEASSAGRVRSLDRVVEQVNRWGTISRNRLAGKILKATAREDGRLVVALGRGNLDFVHRIVLTTFARPRRDGEECRHLDGNPQNNRIENLAWGTRNENMADRKRLGEEKPARGERSGRATLTEQDVHYIRAQVGMGRSYASIGRDIGATRNAVRSVAIGRTWGWLPWVNSG